MRVPNLFFKMVAKRYARDSVVLTRNLPFTQWAGTSPTIRRRRPPCSIAYCIMPTSFRSAAKLSPGDKRKAEQAARMVTAEK
jgi:hypothetical protein